MRLRSVAENNGAYNQTMLDCEDARCRSKFNCRDVIIVHIIVSTAAQPGRSRAVYRLGKLYEICEESEPDLKKACLWFSAVVLHGKWYRKVWLKVWDKSFAIRHLRIFPKPNAPLMIGLETTGLSVIKTVIDSYSVLRLSKYINNTQ